MSVEHGSMTAERCVRVNAVLDEHKPCLCSREHSSMSAGDRVRVNAVFAQCLRVRVFDERCVRVVFALCSHVCGICWP